MSSERISYIMQATLKGSFLCGWLGQFQKQSGRLCAVFSQNWRCRAFCGAKDCAGALQVRKWVAPLVRNISRKYRKITKGGNNWRLWEGRTEERISQFARVSWTAMRYCERGPSPFGFEIWHLSMVFFIHLGESYLWQRSGSGGVTGVESEGHLFWALCQRGCSFSNF